jgi:uncharacterized protein (DUF885 family)
MPRRLLLTALACAAATILVAAAPGDSAKFEALVDQFVKNRDGREGDLSAEALRQRVANQKTMLAAVTAIPATALSPEQRIDQLVLRGQLEGNIFETETLRRWETNPELYVQFGGVTNAMAQEGGTPEERAARVVASLTAATRTLDLARQNLKNPVESFTEGAVYQATEWIGSLGTEVGAYAATTGPGQASIEQANTAAIAALESFVQYLKTDVTPRSNGSFSIGRERYGYLLKHRWYMNDSLEEILARGRRAFAETETLAQQVANRLEPGKSWVEVYEHLKDDHPPADRLKDEYQAKIEAAQAYLKAHDIVTLPEGEHVITIDSPPAMRRSSPFGTFRSVGPFEKNLLGKLVLTPIEDSLTPDQRAERLRSHHRAWIPIIAVHEAYPGHHVQALKANENPRLLRRIVRESIFSEGWGLYCEEMMYEQGFLKGDDVRLTQLRNRLWRAARVIIDVGLQTGAMTFDQGVQFLVDKVRFERYAAELEVGMYTRRPTMVLGYLIGMTDIQAMRGAWEKKYGKPAKLKEFYDKLLHIGAIPPSLVRAELLGEPVAAAR